MSLFRGRYAYVIAVALMAGSGPPTGDTLVNDPSTDIGDANTQSETAIGTHDAMIVVGFNDSGEYARGRGLIGYAYSLDGGRTFRDAGALPARAGTTNGGDPTIAVDREGRFFFATLVIETANSHSFIGVARSRPSVDAVSFSAPVLIAGQDPDGFQDKEWLTADPTSGPNAGNVYVVWTEYYSNQSKTRILFSRSVDHGVTFSPAVQLSSQGPGVQGAAASVGPNGELYVAWEEYLDSGRRAVRLRRSGDGGLTFGPVIPVAQFDPIRDKQATSRCDRYALNGDIRVESSLSLDVDRSNGLGRGRIFVTFAARPSGSANDVADVFVTWSSDGGRTWSRPVSVVGGPVVTTNPDPSGGDNWAPVLVVGTDGRVNVFFYDRRNDPQNRLLELYRAQSMDHGMTWVNQLVSGQPFPPPPLNPPADQSMATCYFGDYNGAARAGNLVHVVWGDARRATSGRSDLDVRFAALP